MYLERYLERDPPFHFVRSQIFERHKNNTISETRESVADYHIYVYYVQYNANYIAPSCTTASNTLAPMSTETNWNTQLYATCKQSAGE